MHFVTASSAGILISRTAWATDLLPTPAQTKGPFYPIPEIEKQKYFDVDLTRLDPNSPVADGNQIAIQGSIVDLEGKPLADTIVEVWQACASGRYNHPEDKNDRPADPNFQYWARMTTDRDGAFSFKTIEPGKYPGRTPHIHYRIVSRKHKELVTQMYFQANEEFNSRDGVYKDLTRDQRKSVTVGLEKKQVDPKDSKSESLPTGSFQIVLGPPSDSKSTRPM